MKQIMNRMASGNSLLRIYPGAWFVGLAVAALAVFVGSFAARADDYAGQGPASAARLSSVEGQVRLLQNGQVIADPALANAPLFAGTQIETGDDGKAEIQFDDGSIARVSPDSGLTLRSVAGDGGPGTDMLLEGGLAYFELQDNNHNGPMRVIFGDSVVTASGFTVMRVKMDTPPGELAVFSGNAHLERGNAVAVDVHGGESVTLDASDPGRYNLSDAIEPDSWDAWNSDRDQALSAAATDQTGAAGNFVNSEVPNPAWNDLDANGNWYNVPGQGYVWSPYEASAAGWDPYGCGHWMWTPRFGYVWVSCESWGYLPYSCGAWNFYDGFGWGWAPGMGGCMPWWRHGGYVGLNIGYAPSGYRPISRPALSHPGSRNAIPVIPVSRRPSVGPSQLPPRDRTTPVQIAGHEVQPMRRMPASQSYVRSASGFVYHPANGYQERRDGGQVINDRPGTSSRPGYIRNQGSDSFVRQSNPQPARTYTPPSQTNNAPDRNNTPPSPVITQPGRIYMPPSQNRTEPNRTQPNRTEPNRTYTPPAEGRPEPSRTYTPPPSRGNSGGGSFSRPSGGGPPAGGSAPHSGGGGSAPAGGGSHGGGGNDGHR